MTRTDAETDELIKDWEIVVRCKTWLLDCWLGWNAEERAGG